MDKKVYVHLAEGFEEIEAMATIDILIRENFDGMHLKDGTVEKIVELYGYKRVEHVLANTVQERRGDGRFRPDNRAWAESHYIPEDEMHNYCFAARSHSAILDGFISNYRKLVMDLGMFDQKQCEPDSSELDYTGKVLVLHILSKGISLRLGRFGGGGGGFLAPTARQRQAQNAQER